ncbi:MAG: TadE/TadG family type IV pilus assembly protein [Acidimicrobiia bacterium]
MRRWFRRDRGASLVETAIVLPVILLLTLGMSEVAFLVVDYLTVTNSAREGARTGASAADYVDGVTGIDADDLILEAVEQAACNLHYSTLLTVKIYQADADGDPVDTTTVLNEYQPGVGGLDCSTSGNGLTCTNGCPWAVATRNRALPTPDLLGVEIVFNHDAVIGFVPFPTTSWTEVAVMRLEPDTKG